MKNARLALALLAALAAVPALAQSTSPVDGITPLGLTPGRPAGSFPLSGFETVNLFSGNLNFALPLLRVEGRGEAGFTMHLTIERRWSLRLTNPRKRPGEPDLYGAEWEWGLKPGYSPGSMYRRTATQHVSRDEERQYIKYQEALTRLTFRRGDGTEHDFRDDALDGEAKGWYEGQAPTFRGARWHSTDGTAASFVSDGDIRDPGDSPGGTTPAGGGRLLLADGTEYRIGDGAGGVPGRVTRIRDRNGNTVRLDYTDGQLTRATDSLGRVATIEYRPSADGQEDEIRYGGFGGAARTILVRRQRMHKCLAEGEETRTYAELFPSVTFPGASTFDPVVPCAVDLPNGTSYDFAYNAYGELARVTLPTGGRFEYEWGSGVDDNAFGLLSLGSEGDGRTWSWAILRRVTSRKVYNYDQLEQWTEYDASGCQLGDCKVDVRHLDPEGQLVRRERHSYRGSPRASFSLEPCDYPAWTDGRETGVEVFDGADNRLRSVANTWAQRAPLPWTTRSTEIRGEPPNDVRLTLATTTLEDGRSSSVRYEHDGYNNVTLQEESDYGGGLLRVTTRGFRANPMDPADPYGSEPAHLRNLPAWEEVTHGGVKVSRTDFEYDQYPQGDAGGCQGLGSLLGRDNLTGWVAVGHERRGNLTSVRRWLDRPGRGSAAAEAVSRRAYDVAGNLRCETDPEGHATTYLWDDNYGRPDANLSDGASLGTFARPTQVRNALGHETQTQFDFETGRPVDQRDPNGVLTLLEYGDPLDRLTRVVHAADVAHEAHRAQTSFTYTDGRWRREVLTHQDQDAFDDGARKTRVRYDELGREWQTARKAPHPQPWIAVDKRYDERGRLSLVSSPYEEEEGQVSQDWTVTRYDALDRPVSVTTPDGAVVRTSYSGPEVTVTDAASRSRTSETDALGRVVAVTEYPDGESPWWTAYTYDPLDRLVGVKQGPQPARSFVYDSLGRLREATNPESGLVRYEYDLGGTLAWRRDARGVETTYANDPLGRVKKRSYSDGTPAVSFTWERDPSGRLPTSLGRLLAVDNGISTTEYTHDPVGRVEASTQRTGGREFTFGYTRDLAGNVVEERYPSGRIVATAIDKLDRVTQVKDAGLTRASGFDYTPHGALQSVLLGNGLTETTAFNVRLQPERIALGAPGRSVLSIDYRYWPRGGSSQSNNGNVWGQTITVPAWHPLLPPTVLDQTYAYDGLNRLAWAREGGGWAQQYRYDRWGNRVVTGDRPQPALSADSLEAHVDPQTNRLLLGLSGYDAAGNQTADPLGRVIEYDAENRQTAFGASTLADGQVLSTLYAYDGEGRRVLSVGPSGRTVFVYDALGRLAAEYSDDTTPMGGAHYLTTDALGSVRVVTDDAARVVSRHDYLPFGEEIPATSGPRADLADYRGADSFRHRFTGKERDRESGLDYFGARYFSGAMGRFTGADPSTNLEPAITNPQRWNRYAYVSNNPLRKVDPDGRDEVDLAVGFVQGVGQAVAGAVGATIALVDSRGLPSFETISAGAAVVEHVELLAQGVANPGEVVDQYVEMSVSADGADQRALGQAVGQGAGVAALTLAPLARGAQAPIRSAMQMPRGGSGVVLADGAGATQAEIAASSGPSARLLRQEVIQQWQSANPGKPFQCWRCGQTTENPANIHVGHRNVAGSRGGNRSPANLCLEGAACNLSSGNRGRPTAGMSCAERGSCGAPYGR